MPIESPITFINSLNASWPLGADDKSTVDDHLRLIKLAVKQSFTGITGAVTVTHTELNLLTGLTDNVQTKLNAYSTSISAINTDISRISQTVSVVVADMARISQTVSVVIALVATHVTRINTLSVTVAAVQSDVARISQTVSVVIALVDTHVTRINTLSASVSLVQADIARISQTVSVVIALVDTHVTRINTLSVTVAAVQSDVARISTTVATMWTAFNAKDITGDGYQKLPGGVIIQWGTVAAAALGATTSRADTITFPLAFPAAVFVVVANAVSNGGSAVRGYAGNDKTTSGFTSHVTNDAGSPQDVGVSWIAIGN